MTTNNRTEKGHTKTINHADLIKQRKIRKVNGLFLFPFAKIQQPDILYR